MKFSDRFWIRGWEKRSIPPQDLCRNTDQAWPPMGAPWRWCPSSSAPLWTTSTTSNPQSGDPKTQHLNRKPHWTNTTCRKWLVSLSYLVVAWDGDVNISQRGVCVAECNGWDVDVRGFCQRLMVSARICNDQEAGLPESSLNLIGEGSRSETTSEGGRASARGELEHSPLTEKNGER